MIREEQLYAPSDDGFQNWPTIIMKHMDLIEDHEFHKLSIRALSTFPGDYVPLLGCAHKNLSCDNFFAL